MALDTIMAALLPPLQAIPGIGAVYPYERLVTPETLPAVMGDVLALRYWCLTRVSTLETWCDSRTVERLHRLRLRGTMAIDDATASERTYHDLLDSALDALSSVVQLPGNAEYLSAAWLERQEPFLLAEVLPVHWSESYVLVSEYVRVPPPIGPMSEVEDYRSLTDWLVEQVQQLPGIGQVYPYERLVADPAQASAVFGPAQAIHAWTVTREHAEAERASGLETEHQDRVLLRGYRTVDDPQASELAFQASLDQIATLLRSTPTVGTFDRVGPLQIEQVAHTLLGQTYVCHFAQCHLPVVTYDVATAL